MIRSLNHFEAIVGYPRKELFKVIDNLNKYFYHFSKLKSSGRFRHFYPSEGLLKDIQNRLVTRIFGSVSLPFFITGSAKGRSNVLNAKIHSGKKYHLQTDLLSYFDFATCKMVYDSLVKIGFSPDISSIITKLTTLNGHLPQGTPTSPFLSNLVGLPIDFAIQAACSKLNIAYSRFIDDINLSSNHDFKITVPHLLSEIQKCGFLYQHKKTVYKTGDIEITGVLTTCNGIKPTKELIEAFNSGRKESLSGYISYINNLRGVSLLPNYKERYAYLTMPPKLTIRPQTGLPQ